MTGLLCVNVLGPDDIYACASRAEAEKLAEEMNAHIAALPDKDHPNWPRLSAIVAPWPGSAKSHAEDLARGAERFR